MTGNGEIRKRAWKILSGKWFLRLVLVGLAMGSMVVLVDYVVLTAFESAEITPLGQFLKRWASAREQGLSYALPTARATFWMVAGFVFEMFICYVFSAIAAFGMAGLMLKAEADRDDRWFAGSFGGFSRPLEMTGLLLLVNVKAMLWTLLLFVPGVVAAYRYRQAWFLKNERPELSARECVAESGRLMKGRKWQAFCLDCSFLWRFVAVTAAMGVLQLVAILLGNGVAAAMVSLTMTFGGCYLLVKVAMAMVVARAVFYRESLREEKA